MKYEGGLRADILVSVAPLEIRNYVALVNKSRVVEECNRKLAIQRSEAHKRRQASQGQHPKQPQQKKPYHGEGSKGNQPQEPSANPPRPADQPPKPTMNPTCPKCGRQHKGICYAGQNVCFKCGQPGHFARNCTKGMPGSDLFTGNEF